MRSRLPLVPLLLSLAAPASAVAGEHPVGGDLVSIRERSPTQRSVRFRATSDPAIDPTLAPDPRTAGATFVPSSSIDRMICACGMVPTLICIR